MKKIDELTIEAKKELGKQGVYIGIDLNVLPIYCDTFKVNSKREHNYFFKIS